MDKLKLKYSHRLKTYYDHKLMQRLIYMYDSSKFSWQGDWEPYVYSGTSELPTPRDHTKVLVCNRKVYFIQRVHLIMWWPFLVVVHHVFESLALLAIECREALKRCRMAKIFKSSWASIFTPVCHFQREICIDFVHWVWLGGVHCLRFHCIHHIYMKISKPII